MWQQSVHRSHSNTVASACNTSTSALGSACPACALRKARRTGEQHLADDLLFVRRKRTPIPLCASRTHSSTSSSHPRLGCSRPRGRTLYNLHAPAPTLSSGSGSSPGSPPFPDRHAVARSASVQASTGVSPGRDRGSSSNSDEPTPVGSTSALSNATTTANSTAASPPNGTLGEEAPSNGLFVDLEDAVPYRNGSTNGKSNGNGNGAANHGASTAASLAHGDAGAGHSVYDSAMDDVSGGVSSHEEVCVVEVGPSGDTATLCLPVQTVTSLPTVADVMQPVPAAVAAAVTAAASTAAAATRPSPTSLPAVVEAPIAVNVRPVGFGFPPDAVEVAASDVRGAASVSYVTGSIDATADTANPDAADTSSNRGPAGGSVDMADTPEGLTDVEVSSVAPVADWLRDQDDITTLTYAVLTGGLVAAAVFVFDVSIQTIHDLPDIFSSGLGIGGGRKTGLEVFGMAVPFRCVMPVAAGFAVAWLQRIGFSPALKVLTRAVEGVTDDTAKAALPKSYWQVARKAFASAITLGSGASLGPEAPSVELGANTAAVIAPKNLSKRRLRMLVAAGAAAGVSAAFDAPVSGALFAVEFVLKSSRLGLDRLSTSTVFVSTSVAAGVIGFLRTQGQALGIAGAGTHLVGRIPYFSIQPNLLVDVAQFSALGLGCSVAAVALYEGVRVSEIALRPLPRWLSAPTAGVLCGIIAYRFPQVQYGYVNLEEIFRDSTGMSAADLTALLSAKIVATSVCVGGGLVGGLFAPSLFLGALVGDILGHFVAGPWGLPDPTSLVVVGAAAVLGAACRAPLTAIALMVEITRDTGLLVPLLAAIGVASLCTDFLEGIFSKRLEKALVELYLREKAFFWAASLVTPPGAGATEAGKTVEDVLGTRARLYVRHTLPLAQAKAAMAAKGSPAAVVVDDNFSPLGVVYAEDVEAELIRQRLLNEPDANFNRQ